MLPPSPALLDQLDALVTVSRVKPEQCNLQPLLTVFQTLAVP